MNGAFPTIVLSLGLPLADLQGYGQSALALWGRLVSATQAWAKAPHGLQEAVLVATAIAGAAVLLMLGYIILLRTRARRETQEFQEELAKLAALTQAAVSANQAKAEFLTSMSHRIRTAMNAIVEFTDLALRPDFDPGLREYLDAVRKSADWAIHIANDVLQFSRIEAGRMQLDKVPFSISECVVSAMKIVEREASAKKVVITCKIDPKLPELVCGDPAQLRHVMLNLLEHAVRFTTSGSLILSAALESNSADDVLVRVAVAGTGVGIPPTKQPLIFERSQSADTDAPLRSGTTSLGLAISRRLVDLMGGTMDLKSQLGAGSTFDFTARFRKQEASAKIETPVHGPESVGLKELSILVAEDNAVVNRAVITETHPRDSGSATKDQALAISALVPDRKDIAIEVPANVKAPENVFAPKYVEQEIIAAGEIAGPAGPSEDSNADSGEGESFTVEPILSNPGDLALDITAKSDIPEAVATSSADSLRSGELPDLESSPYLLPSMGGVETNRFSGASATTPFVNLDVVNTSNVEVESAGDVVVEAEEKPLIADCDEIAESDEIGDSDQSVLREVNQSAEIISILAGMEASYGNSSNRETPAEARLSAPAGLALLEVTCQLTQQSPSLVKQVERPMRSAAWDPFEQARKSLSKSRFDVRVIHNDGDPSDRNLI